GTSIVSSPRRARQDARGGSIGLFQRAFAKGAEDADWDGGAGLDGWRETVKPGSLRQPALHLVGNFARRVGAPPGAAGPINAVAVQNNQPRRRVHAERLSTPFPIEDRDRQMQLAVLPPNELLIVGDRHAEHGQPRTVAGAQRLAIAE